MNKRKFLVVCVLAVFIVGMAMASVSATTYKSKCHSKGSYKHSHKATWYKTYYTKQYVGKVWKNGYCYKKYVKIYQYACICYNKAHIKDLKRQHSSLPYSYYTLGAGSHPKYKYVRIF